MLEGVIDLTKKEPLLIKRIGKNHQFTPYLGWCREDDEMDNTPWIGVEIELSRKFMSIKHIGTGISFFKRKGRYKHFIKTYTSDKDSVYIKEKTHDNNDLNFNRYSKEVISCWKKWLK